MLDGVKLIGKPVYKATVETKKPYIPASLSPSAHLVLAIYNNPTLREIDLRSLKEIRSGGFEIGLNPELCYTGNLSIYLEDSSYETAMISPLRKAANECGKINSSAS